MERDAVDDENSLEELNRRAYSHDGEDALAARRELAGLHPAQEPLAEHTPVDLPPHTRAPRWLVGGLAALALISCIIPTAIAIIPRPSVDIFYRPATAIDIAMQERVSDWYASDVGPINPNLGGRQLSRAVPVAGSTRWLGESQGYDLLAYLADESVSDDGSLVCISLSKKLGRAFFATGSCVAEDEFERSGIQFHMQSRPVSEVIDVTIVWGPTGDARIFDLPLDEVAPR